MAKTAAFEKHPERYESWFDRHKEAYISELLALRPFVPLTGRGLEVGVGTGRFAAPLGIQVGIDPSPAMLAVARKRGIEADEGVAEALPYPDDSFDHVLVVTTLCFVDSPATMFTQIRRVLKPGGIFVIGFIDRDSAMGLDYEARQSDSTFYQEATFYSADQVENFLMDASFSLHARVQTLSQPLALIKEVEPLRLGYGVCGFAVIEAINEKPGP
ncbi:SAM-dependent methyltransferase [Kineobactrum sediminis]|uniref:SAM-dependent methyltransferase n=1 Tax=Kineobactrum sediminis TaxID=1905677 RepID=A0A2N5Y627_9GAMM|nr:class I SAM-dependent methyltransferase [Kineobactrum sediminis]PLW83842.1 SAM-dependent methyltransferase [Kineobactrum sediminis]